ncbi:hypothetical protein JCGZ_20590 [Jatropha curcas]|uniref:Uncharacterized protein n=1 Tax=Jatropha curcas TaxID=180498 RepID=A0A067K0V5_JATCU|nr:uncharacterized protein LOC105645805 [Jatropha curcas]XP_020539690.1 uncharacterized protein LOC105645805 [Jatropha curcas]XP_020539691.1 uncharacterized protein LOC105645805 [Jatropha curcas]XP_037495634.1 uncharacterized protein LOC105645805 [Jatropha curcas]XP_037495635.1 uncharacterized protein LOC105645805 [Jatropha curcas]KDP25434.1 hypothetical protein JCGZ_20590 [Jatropha curcas]
MSGSKRPPRSDQPSIAYRQNQVEGASFDLTNFVLEDHASSKSKKKQQSSIYTEQKSLQMLSTTELISAVGQIWNLVSPLASSESEVKSNHNGSGSEKNVILDGLVVKDVGAADLKDDDCRRFNIDVRTTSNTTALIQPKFEFLKVTQKMLNLEPYSENYMRPLFSQFMKGNNILTNEFQKGKGLASVEILYEFESIYGWMKETIPANLRCHSVTRNKEEKTNKDCASGNAFSHRDGCFSGDATHPGNNNALRSADCYSGSVKSKDEWLGDNMKVAMETETISSLCSDYFLQPPHDNNVRGSFSRALGSSLYLDHHIDFLATHKTSSGTFQHNIDDYRIAESTRKPHQMVVSEDKILLDIRSPPCKQPCYALAKQEHAYAGAFAGIFVSVCLHPVDTIKTVTQSCHAEQKSICNIGRSIVSERGLTGFYRGIASNIASSAPISAIYTFTYESVKGSLLPHFSKEYHSLAHCIAGGSASIATSFVFTPSERIKQQMQIGSHYHNCWNALIGIIGKGGLPSLYAGWGAVLCRNVPHSIIKFYTYESLKQLMLSSQNSDAQPNTLQTLVCGGLAGSTAALFTTPFDVVKTRLQIQIPGSMSKYQSVFHALKEIGKNEGLKGLYRGLIPRLVIYLSQGALFFASYEFFKRLFTLEVPQLNARGTQYKESMEDDSTHLQWPS